MHVILEEDDILFKVVDVKDLPKPVKMAFRTRDVMTEDHKMLLMRCTDF